jgi:hypothetical protein
MSDSADLSSVIALAHKGHELTLKGHDARAAEKFRLAAEEAEKTLPFPDCLVTCSLRHEQLDSLLYHATSSVVTPADADDALQEACLRLLPPVMAVLERRRAVGTLLPGSCRPVEVSYQVAIKCHLLERHGRTQASAAWQAAELAPYVGIGTYIGVASCMAFMLSNSQLLERALVLSDEQKHAGYLFLASAVDLMAHRRDHKSWLNGEPDLVRHLRLVIPLVSEMNNPEAKQLCSAWQRMLQSGVLRARGIDEGIDSSLQLNARVSAALNADLAAGRLQQCALAGCASKEVHVSQFKKCGACRTVAYCCKEHQVEDWPSHKAACKAARKTTAAAES